MPATGAHRCGAIDSAWIHHPQKETPTGLFWENRWTTFTYIPPPLPKKARKNSLPFLDVRFEPVLAAPTASSIQSHERLKKERRRRNLRHPCP
jgi:hypothetical protein